MRNLGRIFCSGCESRWGDEGEIINPELGPFGRGPLNAQRMAGLFREQTPGRKESYESHLLCASVFLSINRDDNHTYFRVIIRIQ